jgi:hypothetical protein
VFVGSGRGAGCRCLSWCRVERVCAVCVRARRPGHAGVRATAGHGGPRRATAGLCCRGAHIRATADNRRSAGQPLPLACTRGCDVFVASVRSVVDARCRQQCALSCCQCCVLPLLLLRFSRALTLGVVAAASNVWLSRGRKQLGEEGVKSAPWKRGAPPRLCELHCACACAAASAAARCAPIGEGRLPAAALENKNTLGGRVHPPLPMPPRDPPRATEATRADALTARRGVGRAPGVLLLRRHGRHRRGGRGGTCASRAAALPCCALIKRARAPRARAPPCRVGGVALVLTAVWSR